MFTSFCTYLIIVGSFRSIFEWVVWVVLYTTKTAQRRKEVLEISFLKTEYLNWRRFAGNCLKALLREGGPESHEREKRETNAFPARGNAQLTCFWLFRERGETSKITVSATPRGGNRQ